MYEFIKYNVPYYETTIQLPLFTTTQAALIKRFFILKNLIYFHIIYLFSRSMVKYCAGYAHVLINAP